MCFPPFNPSLDFLGNLSGNYLEQLTGFLERGYNYGDVNSLRGLATMAAFLQARVNNFRGIFLSCNSLKILY